MNICALYSQPQTRASDRAPQVHWHGDVWLFLYGTAMHAMATDVTPCCCNGRLGTKSKGDSSTKTQNKNVKLVITYWPAAIAPISEKTAIIALFQQKKDVL